MSKTFLNSQKENMNHQNRPQTAAHPDSYETEERKPGILLRREMNN
jgi:hypothetical protein